MKKKLFIILCVVILVMLSVIGITFTLNSKKTIMNTDYVNGNTAGNLYNGGTFCEFDGTIYFSNPSDAGKFYSMDSTGGNLKKLADDIPTYINVDENYIYYIRNNPGDSIDFDYTALYRNGLVRMDHNGKHTVTLDTEPSLYAALLGNYIYYLHYSVEEASTLYKVRIDGKEQKKVMDEAVFTCSTDGAYFYYNGMETDGDIHKFDTIVDTHITVYEGNCYQPVVMGNDVYYIDGNSDYSIVHTNLEYDSPVYITKDSVESYNVYGSYIYYQRFDEDGSALCMIKNDGSDFQVICEGDFCDIHVTSGFVFFREYHSGDVYYFPRTNPEEVELFLPGSLKD